MIEYNLLNGIKLVYYPLPQSYSVSFGLYVNVGVKDETVENNGITHLLEHLHFRKLGDWEQKEIYYNMNKIGAVLNGSTYKELLKFTMKASPKYFSECLEFYLRILSTYDWTEQHLQAEKQIVLNEIDSKELYMSILPYVDEIVWDNSIMSKPILGTKSSLENITLEEIVEYKKQFFGHGNITLVITGNVTENDIKKAHDKIEKITLKCNSKKSIKSKNALYTSDNQRQYIKLVNCDWDYVDVNISFDVDESDMEVAALLNSIIGGGVGSILPDAVREELGIVYDIYSTLDLYNDKSVLNVIFSAHKDNILKCLEVIVFELNKIKENITEKHIAANKPYFTDNLWYLLEESEKLNDYLGWEVFKDDFSSFSIENCIETYEKINKEKLMQLAKKIFLSQNAAVVMLGETTKISKSEIERILFCLM